jgi:hypothetical protein
MKEKSVVDRLSEIERKLDMLIDAMGLSDKRRLSSAEIKEMAIKIVSDHKRKRKKS